MLLLVSGTLLIVVRLVLPYCLIQLGTQDKMPVDVVPEKVATAPSKEPIAEEEEGDATTVESAAEDPVAEEAENADPEPEKEEDAEVETKEIVSSTEEKTETKQSPFVCCEGDVLKNLQAAVGLA